MRGMNSNVSFTSLIKPIGLPQFYSITADLPKRSYVPYPWTLNESALSSDVFTKSVMDCSVYIISDGQKAKMLHICPGCSDAKNFERIEKSIEKDFDLNSDDIEAFVVGGKSPSLVGGDSYELFDKFVKFSEKHNIPTTILKGGMGEKFIAYSCPLDTLYIANTQRFYSDCKRSETPLDILKNWFNVVKIHSKDRVTI